MKICTHNGPFHADDVLACAILKKVFPQASVLRSRHEVAIEGSFICFDVGAEYDPGRHRYDHHQVGGAGARDNGVKYSSAGLIWKHFGPMLVHADVASRVDQKLIQSVDAIDNGQRLFEGGVQAFEGVESNTFSKLIHDLNPVWDEPQEFDAAFERAVELATLVLDRAIAEARSSLKAEAQVKAAIAESKNEIVQLRRFMPWEPDMFPADKKFVVFPDPNDTWMVQCIPPSSKPEDRFKQRLPLPENLAGLRGNQLIEATGVVDAVFVHNGRFIGGARTFEGAMQLAKLAL